MLSNKNIKIHLPSAHYVIRNYSTEKIPPHDKQILDAFGDKCFDGYIDYAAYNSDDNKNTDYYGFDIDELFLDIAIYITIKDYKDQIDKVVTVVFTDKDKSEMPYPEGFYECFDVHCSKSYNDNIINYDFKQLFI